MARSVAPKSSAPASDVIAPASNAATTSRPSTGSNPKKSGLHSVGIGALRKSSTIRCDTTVFVDSQPRCTQLCEKSTLGHQGPFCVGAAARGPDIRVALKAPDYAQ